MAVKQFALAGITAAASGEVFSSTIVTGDPMLDIILKIALPIITGVIAPSITKLVDAWVYAIKNNHKIKKQKQNEKNNEKNTGEKSSEESN